MNWNFNICHTNILPVLLFTNLSTTAAAAAAAAVNRNSMVSYSRLFCYSLHGQCLSSQTMYI
jgi:hypothetical protein